jgi:hypothetical protein
MDITEAVASVVGISVATERVLESLSWGGTMWGNKMMNDEMIPDDEEKDVNNWKWVKQIKLFLSIVFGPLIGCGKETSVLFSELFLFLFLFSKKEWLFGLVIHL